MLRMLTGYKGVLSGFVTLAAVVMATVWCSHASARGARPVVAGQGALIVGNKVRTFAVSVVMLPNGTVRGVAQVFDRSPEIRARAHIVIDCAKKMGNTVLLSGRVAKTNVPSLLGKPAVFAVHDGGRRGAGDRITLVEVFTDDHGQNCLNTEPPIPFMPIKAGNIRVFP